MPATALPDFFNLPGADPQGGYGAFGGVPQIPNPVGTAGQAVAGNLGNIPGIMGIINAADPHYGQEQGLTGQWLAGQVPGDVKNLLAQQGAERGVATGSPGSPNANAAWLRSLGLTSLGLQGQGMQAANALSNRTFSQMSPWLVTGEQQQGAQTAANVYRAAPNPAANVAALSSLFPGATRPTGGGGLGAPWPGLTTAAPAVGGALRGGYGGTTTGTPGYGTLGADPYGDQAQQDLLDSLFGGGTSSADAQQSYLDDLFQEPPGYAGSQGTEPFGPMDYQQSGEPFGTQYDPNADQSYYDPFAEFSYYE